MKTKRFLFVGAAFLAAGLLLLPATVRAQDKWWVGTPGATNAWDVGANWTGGTEPTTANSVRFSNTVANTGAEIGSITARVQRLLIGTTAASSIGHVVINGGTLSTTGGGTFQGRIVIADAVGSSGTLTLNAGSVTVSTDLLMGYAGTGYFYQNGGSVIVTNNLWLGAIDAAGDNANTLGRYTLTDGTLRVNGTFQIGSWGKGEFYQSGGVVTAVGDAKMAAQGGSPAKPWRSHSLTIAGGTFNVAGTFDIADRATGVVSQSAGTVAVNNMRFSNFNDGTSIGDGTYNLSGGTLIVTNQVYKGLGFSHFNFTGGTLQSGSDNFRLGVLTDAYQQQATAGNSLFDVRHNTTVSNAYTATGSGANLATIRVAASKTLTMDGANALNIGDKAVLEGHGTVNANGGVWIQSGGMLSPGTSTGELIVNNLVLQSGSVSFFEIDGLEDHDQVRGADIAANTGWILRLQFGAGMFGESGSVTLFDYADNYDTSLPTIQFVGDYSPDTANFEWTDGDFGQGVLHFGSVIPEPSTFGLLALTSLAVALRRRRRA